MNPCFRRWFQRCLLDFDLKKMGEMMQILLYLWIHNGVSKNRGTPKTPQNDHFSRKSHGCWGNPPLKETTISLSHFFQPSFLWTNFLRLVVMNSLQCSYDAVAGGLGNPQKTNALHEIQVVKYGFFTMVFFIIPINNCVWYNPVFSHICMYRYLKAYAWQPGAGRRGPMFA